MGHNQSKTTPLVSVILPVYNADAYVADAVQSILDQTFTDFEFIIIDDGSTDNSLSILKELAHRDSRIRLLTRENHGLIRTLNEAIDLVRGEWIARMDADDISMPERFQKQLSLLKQSGADICGCSMQCFGQWTDVWRYPATHEGCEVQMLFDPPVAHPTVMGRSLLFKTLYYSLDFPHAEDYDLWQRAIRAGFLFSNVSETLLRYRISGTQASRMNNSIQIANAKRVQARQMLEVFPDIDQRKLYEVREAVSSGKGLLDSHQPELRLLLERYHAEGRDILLRKIYIAFCNCAGSLDCPGKQWKSLMQSTNVKGQFFRGLHISILGLFRHKK